MAAVSHDAMLLFRINYVPVFDKVRVFFDRKNSKKHELAVRMGGALIASSSSAAAAACVDSVLYNVFVTNT